MRRIVIWDLFLTFFAATQDIAMDAWRIESAPISMQGAMAAAYQVGYRIALIAGSAGALDSRAGLQLARELPRHRTAHVRSDS